MTARPVHNPFSSASEPDRAQSLKPDFDLMRSNPGLRWK
jgi:hypothetical protein